MSCKSSIQLRAAESANAIESLPSSHHSKEESSFVGGRARRKDKADMIDAREIIFNHKKQSNGLPCDCLSSLIHNKAELAGLAAVIDGCRRFKQETFGYNKASSFAEDIFFRNVLKYKRCGTASLTSQQPLLDDQPKKRHMFRYIIGDHQRASDDYCSSSSINPIATPIEVCRQAFLLVYDISKKRLERYRNELRKNKFLDEPDFNDRSRPDQSASDRLCNKRTCCSTIVVDVSTGKEVPLELTREECQLLRMPNGVGYKSTVAWMRSFFELVGDQSPNGNEITLESQCKNEIYEKEYLVAMREQGSVDEAVEESVFNKIWRESFPHVSIREYKAVTGKCGFCAVLSDLRRQKKASAMRKEITDLHSLHRITYMSERRIYYERINRAKQEPDRFMSIIMDGMAQNHTDLPYLANQKDFPAKMDMHLQGVLEHGIGFTVYRTFGNVRNDSNSAIHCLLLHLERRIRVYGCLPPTLYIQIDGGSENANQWMLATCELLVASGFTCCIYLTRLPVGHTHEDIDGKFGMLWRKIRKKSVLTPQAYERVLYETFGTTPELPFEMKDVFAVCDYQTLFEGCIDSALARWTKEDVTQLAWKFERINISKSFPLGVKTTYRAYSSDTVYEIIKSAQRLCGYGAARVHSKWGPTANIAAYGSDVEGMFVLSRFPRCSIMPAEFQEKFLENFARTLQHIHRIYGTNSADFAKECIEEWNAFKIVYPSADKVDDYVFSQLQGSFKAPMQQSLFRGLSLRSRSGTMEIIRCDITAVGAPTTSVQLYNPSDDSYKRTAEQSEDIVDMIATHSVGWSNRGSQQPFMPPRVELPKGVNQQEADLEALRLNHLINLSTESIKLLQGRVLKGMCRMLGLSLNGKKDALVERILRYREQRERSAHNLPRESSNSSGRDATIRVIQQATPPRIDVVVATTPAAAVVNSTDAAAVRKLKVAELRELCLRYGVSASGKKEELRSRLLRLSSTPPPANG